MRPEVVLIAAVTADGGIGWAGKLLVRIGADQKRFRALTLGHPVVMGRRTFESIGKPLPGRDNIVLTREPAWHAEGARRAGSFGEALGLAGDATRVSVVGGTQVYAQALPRADVLELTEVDTVLPADAWFPPWDRSAFREVSREPGVSADGLRYAFVTYRRRAPEPAP